MVVDVEDKDRARRAIVLKDVSSVACIVMARRTFLVPLCKAQIDSLLSTLSPMVYGMPLDFAIADATADLRKSMKGKDSSDGVRGS